MFMCNRCGKYMGRTEKERHDMIVVEARRSEWRWERTKAIRAKVDYDWKRYELCPRCAEEMEKWIFGGEMTPQSPSVTAPLAGEPIG